MVKTKKTKKSKVKKIANVLQRVVVNVAPQARAKSNNNKKHLLIADLINFNLIQD